MPKYATEEIKGVRNLKIKVPDTFYLLATVKLDTV
tara:strand:- start:8721 stop:8825 length:105 start_codon:yes stop_codon:yes gene_type:complete